MNKFIATLKRVIHGNYVIRWRRKREKHVTAEGQETSKNFAEQVNGTPFQYGDTIKVYHAESDRLSWYKTGELLGKGDAKKFKEISFKITPNGLEQVQ